MLTNKEILKQLNELPDKIMERRWRKVRVRSGDKKNKLNMI